MKRGLRIGTWATDDSIEGHQLASILAEEGALKVTVGGRQYVAVNITRDEIRKWQVLELSMAPA